jgi:hypothetical protein
LLINKDDIVLDDLVLIIKEFETSPLLIDEYFQILLKEYKYYHLIFSEYVQTKCYVRSKFLLTSHLIMHEFRLGEEFARAFL